MGLDDAARDRVEVAALLHDIGKIGIPDRIHRKPEKLTVDEQLIMDTSVQHEQQRWRSGSEIRW